MKAKNIFAVMLCGAMMASFMACENGNEPNDGSSNENGNGNQTEEQDFNPNGHEYVDLGLPSGTLWATCNVGANSPEEYGDYFAWGEVEPKANYDDETYIFFANEEEELTKYCTLEKYGENGFVDNITTLELQDDAAAVNWGGSWRMPTFAEQKELLENCTWILMTQNGKNGYQVEGKNGNSIFVPFAGMYDSTTLDDAAEVGCYWSSSLRKDMPTYGYFILLGEYIEQDMERSFPRCYGLSVRAVCSPNK